MIRWRAIAATTVVMAGTVAFPAAAGAVTIPTPIGGVTLPGTSALCAFPISAPAVTSPGGNLSGLFDGKPSVPETLAVTDYERLGSHPFSWAVVDPGCLGDASRPTWTMQTWVGDQLLGMAQDVAGFANGLNRAALSPTWLHLFDRAEAQTTRTLQANIWDLFLPLSLTLIGVLLIARARRGALSEAVKIVAWTLLVMGVVTVVASEPTKIGAAADSAETAGVSSVSAALVGQQYSSVAAFGSIETSDVIGPAWSEGELGSSTSPTALQYGPRLLNDTAYSWWDVQSKANSDRKHTDFLAVAKQVKSSDPSAYSVLQGNSGGRIGDGAQALGGVLVTVPFQVVADLLVVAALLLLRLAVVLLPLLAVIGVHYQFRGVLIRVLSMVAAALINAVIFASAAAVNVYLVGFLLSSDSVPLWFGLVLSGLIAVTLWLVLKPVRHLTSMMNASDVSHALSRSVADLRSTVERAGKIGAATVTGGPAAGAVVAVRPVAERERVNA